MIELETIGTASHGNRIVTDAPYILIGRSPACNFVLPDRRVSWHHGEVVCRDQKYIYSDLRSTHGSVLRRGDVDRPVQTVRLRDGDVILFAGKENALRVNRIGPFESAAGDYAVTVQVEGARAARESEDLFVDDAGALRAFLSLERSLAQGGETGQSGMLQSLIEQVGGLYPELDYIAILAAKDRELVLEQSLSTRNRTYPRKSAKICKLARTRAGGFVFEITAGRVVARNGESSVALSDHSATIEHDTSGICVPLRPDSEILLFIQLERSLHHGKFGERDLGLVQAMSARTEDRIRHLAIARRYAAASQNAALGIFAQTLAHDIKNALTFAPFVREKLADPKRHTDVVRGVETAYQLARSLQSPARSDARAVDGFSLAKTARGIAESFGGLFECRCRFEANAEEQATMVVGYGHLLHRTIWNLVLNAYNAHENREVVPREERFVRISAGPGPEATAWIAVEDNAGGMSPELLVFFQKSFAMIKDACAQDTDILRVVEMIRGQEGAVNRVGLFFSAIAVNDMHGELEVQSLEGEGTTFRIRLPERIEKLKGLLQF